jgi:hypothetical protein
MKFRVTSVAWEDCSRSLGAACIRVEDWLAASLSDGSFGEGIDQVSFVVVSLDEDAQANAVQAAGFDKLGRYIDPIHSRLVRYLSYGLSLPYKQALPLSVPEAVVTIGGLIQAKADIRPKRLPKGYDYQRLSESLGAAAKVLATAA